MKIRTKKRTARILILMLAVCYCAGYGFLADRSYASGTLSVKAGFYGGPYYEVETFSYGQMCQMAEDATSGVFTYSGMDTGNFIRICYAWGVPLEYLVSASGVDLDSVQYFHMATSDNYGESYTTFSADTLFANRYFYPYIVNFIEDTSGSQWAVDYSKVTGEAIRQAQQEAQQVPTMLAIKSTAFSREEAINVVRRGGYSTEESSLTEQNGYRLLYGQQGLSNGAGYNVQSSDKWVTEINLQLAGAPNINVEKELISGKENQIGSKYQVTLDIDLPASYGYLSDEVLRQLEEQVLSSVYLNDYDQSVVRVTKTGNNRYTVEVIGEGDAELKFSYSRTGYGGSSVSASGSTSISGSIEEEPETPDEDPDGTGGNSGSSNQDGTSQDKGNSNAANDRKVEGNSDLQANLGLATEGQTQDNDKSQDGGTAQEGGPVSWVSAELESGAAITPVMDEEKTGVPGIGIGAGILFLMGAGGAALSFYRSL